MGFTTPTPITFRNTEDINLINFGSKKQIERILFTKPCFIEKTFTGYFGYSEKVFDEHSLGEMFKNIIIFRDQKQEMEIYNLWKKSFFRMLFSDCVKFDKNQNNTTILANDTYFDHLYPNVIVPKFLDYTEELEALANFFIKKDTFLKEVLIEAVNLRMYENSNELTELEQINWVCYLNFSNFFVDNRSWEERCLAFWEYKKTKKEKKNEKKYPYAFNGQ